MKRILVVQLLSPVALVVVMVLSMTWAMPANALKLWGMERSFTDHAHPADSALIAPVALLGILDGNGNHCDFLVGQWRQGGPDRAATVAAYAGTGLDVYFPDAPMTEDNYAPDSIRISAKPEVTGGYLVYEYDGMGDPSGDMRCW